MNEQWTKRLRNRIAEHQETPPQGLFSDIQAEMSRRGLAMPNEVRAKSNSKRTKWVAPVSICASVAAAAAIVAGVFLFNGNDNASPSKQMQASATQQTTSNKANAQNIPTISPSGNTISANVKTKTGNVPAKRLVAITETDMLQTASVENVAEKASAENNMPKLAAQNGNGADVKAEKKAVVGNATKKSGTSPNGGRILGNEDDFSELRARKQYGGNAGTISVGAYYGGTTTHSGSTQGVMLASANPFGDYSTDMKSDGSGTAVMGTSELKTKSHHKLPIKVGVSVRYNITPKLSVQTGVDYSYLSSDFDFSDGKTDISSAHQALHYIGVPLKAAYSLVKKKKVNLYVAAGGEVEKLVKGKSTTTYLYDKKQPELSEKVSEKRPQFSVNAAAGVEYNFTESAGVFVEPGISYYIDNGSDVENIYKKRPANFSISLGLRINLNK